MCIHPYRWPLLQSKAPRALSFPSLTCSPMMSVRSVILPESSSLRVTCVCSNWLHLSRAESLGRATVAFLFVSVWVGLRKRASGKLRAQLLVC